MASGSPSSRRILLFGVSADPPTGEGGHLGLVRWAARRGVHPEMGGRLDAIWVVPVHRHAFAEKDRLAPFEDRVEMCRLCFEGRDLEVPVQVSRAEEGLARSRGGARLGTIDLIEHLEAAHPETRFGLLLGADTARDLLAGRWRRGDELRERVPLVIAPRPGVAEEGLAVAEDAPVLDEVSSTAARAAAGDAVELRRYVTEEVARYIERRGLYGAGPATGPTPR